MNVFFDMVGCRLNQSEIETFARQFRLAGHALVSDAQSADLAVINTCTVTASAASDSRQKVRQAVRAGAKKVVATGCHASLWPEDVTRLSNIIQVIGNPDKETLVQSVLNLPASMFSYASIARQPVPGSRLRTRAFIKVQDGCDNYCTYCITRLARGASKSRLSGEILLDIKSALEGGGKEIVLTGVHLGSWGNDFEEPAALHQLIHQILKETGAPRIHLSSVEPWDVTPKLLALWQDARLCRHLHLPLQSGCAATLKRMGRKITPASYAELVQMARELIPGVSITTDIITGFPGESESEFTESTNFVQEMNFSGGHVFTFSPREGTPAMSLPDQINPAVSKRRNYKIRQILEHSAAAFRQQQIGSNLAFLCEKAAPVDEQHWQLTGLSDNYLRIHATCSNPCKNQILDAHITGLTQDGLSGEILLK